MVNFMVYKLYPNKLKKYKYELTFSLHMAF